MFKNKSLPQTLDIHLWLCSKIKYCFNKLKGKERLENKKDENKKESSELAVFTNQRLLVGDIVKGYKDLCKILEEPVLAGNSKKAQLKEWKRYFDYKKEGHKFIITNVHETPLLKETRSDSIYVKHMNKCILNLLAQTEGYVATFSRLGWYRELGLVQGNYKKKGENYSDFCKDNGVSYFGMNNFQIDCDDRLWGVFKSSLSSLKNFYSLIEWDYERIITFSNGSTKEATPSETKKYLKAKQYAHDSLGITSMWSIKSKGKTKSFYDLVDEYIFEHYGWYRYHERIRVIYNEEGILKILSQDEIRQEENILRDKIANGLEDKANKKYDKNLKMIDEKVKAVENEVGFPIADREERTEIAKSSGVWILPDNYLEEYKFLLNYFIRGCDTDNVVYDMDNMDEEDLKMKKRLEEL